MIHMNRTMTTGVLAIGFFLGLGQAQSPATVSPPQQEKVVTTHVSGNFDVKLTPETLADKGADKTLARMAIDKQFHGDLEATSKGEMLSAVTPVKGSAGYVAIERVTGTLKGRKGSFVLQHSATMARGTPHLNVVVVPDSGTDELTGLAGRMTINIAPGGQHSYDFEYTFADTP